MNPKIQKPKNYDNVFPDNRDFFFLDSYEKIKDFKTTNFEDPEYICVISENNEKQIKENLYIRTDFLKDYEFIKVDVKNSKNYINFIISKWKINIGGRELRLLTEIKNRPLLIKEIYRKTKINFNTQDNIVLFKESFSVPPVLKFYNRIFTLYISGQNKINNTISNLNSNFSFPTNQTINNNYINNYINNNMDYIYNNKINNNINYNNNIQEINNNNYNEYNSKEDPKGHTGFL